MKKIFFIGVVALALAACDNNEDNPATSQVAAKIWATIGESTVSRAVENSWNEGDSIGISSTVGTVVGPYINVKYTTEEGTGEFKGTQLFFYKPMILTAYYPFTGVEGKVPGPHSDGIIEANTRPDYQKPAMQPKIDFLWDTQTGFTATDPRVFFKFAHKMSKVTFIFQSSGPVFDEDTHIKLADGVDVRYLESYKINNLKLDGTFDTNTGVCSAKADAPAEFLSMKVENVKDSVPVLPIILFPQSIDGGSTILDLYTNELNSQANLQHYKCSLSFSNGEIKAGYHYIYRIKVTKIGLIVGEMSVKPWVEEDRFMTATIDGENVFK